MEACEQAKGQSVLAHGKSVHRHLVQLIKYLRGEATLDGW